MKSLRTSVMAAAVAAAVATPAFATELTIAIVNNGHMINMQKVAEAYTADTGVKLNWVSLEEGVLREQVTSDRFRWCDEARATAAEPSAGAALKIPNPSEPTFNMS